MAVVNITEQILQDTADAIREMTGDEAKIQPVQFPELIKSIETGPAVTSITIDDKSKTEFQPGEDATYHVTVAPEYANQNFTVTSSQEDVATVTADTGASTITVHAVENESMSEEDEFHSTITVTAGKRDPKTDTLEITVKLVTLKPVDKNNVDLDNLSKIVQEGKASEYLVVGDLLQMPMTDGKMPFRVVGFEDKVVRIGDEDKTVHAINFDTAYTESYSEWGHNTNGKYSESILRTAVKTQIEDQMSPELLGCIGVTKVQSYNRDGTTDTTYDKFFAPSIAELGVTDTAYNGTYQKQVEGPAMTYYEGSDNSKRIKNRRDATTTAAPYWTRSIYLPTSKNYSLIYYAGEPADSINSSRYVAAACNFIGKSA